MKKTVFIVSCLLVSFVNFSQEKILTKTGNVIFEASVPSFEEVKATHKNVTCILNSKTGEIASLILVKGFGFKIALMEEHFNENYIESNLFPKATFKGKIENFNTDKLTNQFQEFTLKGKMELHGKSKDIIIIVKIKKTNSEIYLISNFVLKPNDFDIEIPNIVSKKLADKVNVKLDFKLK